MVQPLSREWPGELVIASGSHRAVSALLRHAGQGVTTSFERDYQEALIRIGRLEVEPTEASVAADVYQLVLERLVFAWDALDDIAGAIEDARAVLRDEAAP